MPAFRAPARGQVVRAFAAVAILAALVTSAAPGASSPVVVTMTVPSATTLTNQCTQSAAWNFGSVLPGTPATTAVGSGVCRVRFSSSNDTSALRMYQADRENTAMSRADPQWDMRAGDQNAFHAIDTTTGGRVIAVGSRSIARSSLDSGVTFPTGGSNTGGNWDNLNDVDMVDATPAVAWAAGHNANVVHTTDSGSTWGSVGPGASAGHQFAVLAIDVATAYIGGSGGVVRRTTNTGATWVPVTSNMTSQVNDFARRAANDMWLAGASNGIRRSTDGGTTWNAPTGAVPTWAHWSAIDVTGTSTVWAAGGVEGRASIIRSGDHGATWSDVSTWDGQEIEDMHAVSDSEAWVVGRDGTIMRTINGGSTWIRYAFPSTSTITGIASASDGTIVVATMNHEVYRTTTGASFPLTYDGNTIVPLSAVAAPDLDRRTFVAVGDDGTVRRSTDRGTTWATIAPVTTAHLRAVSLALGGTGWAVGNGGVVLRTTDGGATWSTQTSSTTADLYGVHAVNDRVGWAVGRDGRVIRTTNGGTTWAWITSGTSQHLWAISALDANVAWIGGTAGRIRVTTDGGATWVSRDHPSGDVVYQLHAVSTTTVYGTNDWPGAIATTDGGVTWTDSLSEGGRKAFAFERDRPVAIAANWANVKHTNDLGVSWTEHGNPGHYLHSRGMAAIDANRVVLVGENGTISVSRIRTPIPDFGGVGSTWASPASGLFGVCLQDAGAGTTPAWSEDAGNTPGLCQPLAGDAWNAVPQVPTTIASTTLGTDAYVDLVWGVHVPSNQAPGTYAATVTFETIAPAA